MIKGRFHISYCCYYSFSFFLDLYSLISIVLKDINPSFELVISGILARILLLAGEIMITRYSKGRLWISFDIFIFFTLTGFSGGQLLWHVTVWYQNLSNLHIECWGTYFPFLALPIPLKQLRSMKPEASLPSPLMMPCLNRKTRWTSIIFMAYLDAST